ncbi:M28 family peptidase [Hirschia baltica]|uniref:Carboxypeptidase Q n=1 Tax=Hirschia baltica (strain ATCC 49814 / DSM 5838 / IFAM 1418) TaxID=582402 RepID=C6XN77_HIRBI|nr:M28 family peptidase [Hirschia baltica]ACT58247.1 peptidase M28 [Hirschia baltica ATCC 49814]
MIRSLIIGAVSFASVACAHAQTDEAAPPFIIPADIAETAQTLKSTALESNLGFRIIEDLTTQIGPRLAGTPQEARAREWGMAKLKELGFENVREEPFELDLWTRGHSVYEEVTLTAPYPQPLYAISLGGGGATPEEGSEAEVVYFASYDALKADTVSDLAGKIVFVGDRMTASRTGEGYGWANRKRRDAWVMAEDRGATALFIRSVGTSNNRFAHTGMMSFPEGRHPKIPALSVSNPDADQIERIAKSGEVMKIKLKTFAGWRGKSMSGNVIGEIVGREKPDEIVVIGGHLDSWDTGTGALDDGAGVGITMAAAKLIANLPENPRRTIRVVLFGSEEVGLVGARAYAAARIEDETLANHVMGSESDFGAGEVWRFGSNVGPDALPAMDAIGRELADLGIIRGDNESGGGPDMIPLAMAGVPMGRLDQNGEDYFEYHHTPNDTLDKIDEDELQQNIAAWSVFTYLAAELDVDFRAGEAEAE